MIKSWRLCSLLIIMVLLVACSSGSAPEAETESERESQAGSTIESSDFPFMGVAELDRFLADNNEKPTMVLFWTTWCPSCKQQIPEMEQLNKSHGEKMNIITISLDENVAALASFFKKGRLDLPVYIGNDVIAERFEVSAIPTLVIFDKQGKQTFSKAGIFPHSMLKAMADNLIK
ncbi:MAG: TlpA family protein disulfide reductase [Pseudodesulfovibrio sp.]|nr:TlpA family protein disulfide reductase [Pseudodesulfovibrio sp.]